MVNVQSEFLTFHDKIKLSEENQELRNKRDILLNKLRKNISDKAASFTTFNQGSYAMGTGIKPDDGDFDIDVGLKFDIDHDDYSDPVQVKQWVKDALDGHTKSVKIRRSCVTVTKNRYTMSILRFMQPIMRTSKCTLRKGRNIPQKNIVSGNYLIRKSY